MDSSSLEATNLITAPADAAVSATPESPDLGAKTGVREQLAGHKEGRRASAAASSERTWQRRLLPLMVGLLVTLTAFFFVASFVQLYYLQTRIERAPLLDLSTAMASLDEIGKDLQNGKVEGQLAFNNRLEYARWKTVSLLEANALQRRYHHAGVLLISRIWTRYLGFVTGTILAMVGAAFILGKLQEASSNLGAEGGLWKVSLTTASPGLVLATLGTLLMLATLATNMELQVNDGPVYLRDQASAPADAPPPPFGRDDIMQKPRSDADILKDMKGQGAAKR
jgi:hypothetical protein